MGMPSAGTIVTINFPFSDLSSTKRRPALTLASVGKGDVILCQITSKPYSDPTAIVITPNDFNQGILDRESFARPGKLFTAHQSIICQEIATIKAEKFNEIIHRLHQIISRKVQ
ncbi:type II toxin-antitoxin system PemK/MazF family toxin [Endozoicomonas sp. ONNA1]|uniref:type II toxin-antitoxin system PemK/MazF family toxin n=2 Tax=unclassified Endozoicomonas TaxID=2644528 RepID=UPI00214778DA|nr:type II toxin-antitoxin system PemK/MazF family toxin [Endozoicomonas sp. ONNA1]